ncbi:MAG: hypothetical protein B5M56_07945 [Desulfococcus sp. 4484_241]|nr:MAG: hypothetical protein B5M56_07945 [Desulfococcus sp. 4484_241]
MSKTNSENALFDLDNRLNLLFFSFACPKEKDTRQLGLWLPSAALHGIKNHGHTTTMRTG